MKAKQPLKKKGGRQMARTRSRGPRPWGFSFKREAKWMTAMNLAPFGIGVVLALIFWFTR